MHHPQQAGRRQRELLDKVRWHLNGTRSYTDQALLTLIVVARTQMAGRFKTRVMRVAGALAALIVGFVASLVPGFLAFALLLGLQNPALAVGGLCAVVATLSLAAFIYGFNAGWRADLYREVRLLLADKPCCMCGALPGSGVLPSADGVCDACRTFGATVPSPAAIDYRQRFRHVAATRASAGNTSLNIGELHDCSDAEAAEVIRRINAGTWGRAVRWLGWFGITVLVACTFLAVAMSLSTTPERTLITQILIATAWVLVGWGMFSLGRSALRSFLAELAESALSPRRVCFECGYPLADLEPDGRGLAKCSECGLLARPIRKVRESPDATNTKP